MGCGLGVHWQPRDGGGVELDLVHDNRIKLLDATTGTSGAGGDAVWDQGHILQSGMYDGTHNGDGQTFASDGWMGRCDHSLGIRDHGRYPL